MPSGSIDASRKFGVTTGISAADRSKTIQLMVDPATKPSDLIGRHHDPGALGIDLPGQVDLERRVDRRHARHLADEQGVVGPVAPAEAHQRVVIDEVEQPPGAEHEGCRDLAAQVDETVDLGRGE